MVPETNTKGKNFLAETKKVKRKKKTYVSPFRQEQPTPAEVVCVECKLPSTKGLPPFIAVNRLVDGEIIRTLRHYTCPSDADGILPLVIAQRTAAKKRRDEYFAPTKGRVVSYSQIDGEEVRTVIA